MSNYYGHRNGNQSSHQTSRTEQKPPAKQASESRRDISARRTAAGRTDDQPSDSTREAAASAEQTESPSEDQPIAVRVSVRPGVSQALSPVTPVEGEVIAGRSVDIGWKTDLGLRLAEPAFEPGMKVTIVSTREGFVAKPTAQFEAGQESDTDDEIVWADERREIHINARLELRAHRFWEQYDIPIKFDVGVKRRGNSPTPKTDDEILSNPGQAVHFYACESINDGRLKRTGDEFLCDDRAKTPEIGVRRENAAEEKYLPQVTCKRCQRLMQRWLVGDTGEA